MNLITVIPITKSKISDTLSYFTSSDLPIGAMVTVPLRSKSIPAIVIECRSAILEKSGIRKADYVIRKLGRIRATTFFPQSYIEAYKTLADYYATSLGSIINSIISKSLLENAQKITSPQAPALSTVRDETYAVQGDDNDRLSTWRSLIRQEFARKKSLVIYVPTHEEARNISAQLSKGIEDYIFILHGGLTTKKITDTWEAIAENKHPVVIVATGSFSIMPRNDIETVIIERENGRGWIGRTTPYLDIRQALEITARRQHQSVYLADCLLRTETLYRLENHEISESSPCKWKSISTADDVLVDMKTDLVKIEDGEAKAHFRVLSGTLEKLVVNNREESSHLFIMTARRGLAPLTVCDDCETVVLCQECKSPVVLHTANESGRNFFMCHKCGARRSANEVCMNCGGWRLTPLGIGSERVVEEIRTRFPDIDVIKIDADATPTEKQIDSAMHRFRSKPGSILVGTETALLHIDEPVDHVAVASLDSLFGLPDFRSQERLMYSLIRLRTIAKRTLLVQTRKAEEKVFDFGMKGNLGDFYRGTIRERKQFSYPPLSHLIKISIEGKKDAIAQEMAAVQTLLEPSVIEVFPVFTSTVRGNPVIHGVIKVPAPSWPDKVLTAKLRSLPPQVKVQIDPESLL